LGIIYYLPFLFPIAFAFFPAAKNALCAKHGHCGLHPRAPVCWFGVKGTIHCPANHTAGKLGTQVIGIAP